MHILLCRNFSSLSIQDSITCRNAVAASAAIQAVRVHLLWDLRHLLQRLSFLLLLVVFDQY